jgi:hypothetical protein
VKYEIIETRGRVDAGNLPDCYGNDRADVVEIRFLPDRSEGGDGEVGAVERLENQCARAHFQLVVVFLDELDWVVPEIERSYRRA